MTDQNQNSRLETFCDGVFAIALTLLIIDIKIPVSENINTTNDLWLALKHLLPSVFAFLLSFVIIFITWVNHHAVFKLIHKSSPAFIYANGFLLLTVVVIPFPTALLGEYLFTNHAAPAVVLYAAANGLQAIGWILLSRATLKPNLVMNNEKSTLVMRNNYRSGYFALSIYTICAIVAFWFPLTVAFLISAIWVGWLIYSINIKSE
jgi:TMEM175 potassium channel family protein